MSKRLVNIPTIGALLLFGLGLSEAAQPGQQLPKKGKPMTEEIESAQKKVEEQLITLRAAEGKVEHVSSEVLGRTFPRYSFFSVLYRQYPVAHLPPPPLKGSNLFIVPKDHAKLKIVTDSRELETFFQNALPPIKIGNQARDVVRAWLELFPVLLQDGYYKFSLIEESINVTEEKTALKATGKVVVMAGGNGTIEATAVFDDAGKLTTVQQTIKVRRGPRPICQATKLLDADPIVRRMAEEDLVAIGSAAKPYLEEKRAHASPDLQKAIDRIWERIREEDR